MRVDIFRADGRRYHYFDEIAEKEGVRGRVCRCVEGLPDLCRDIDACIHEVAMPVGGLVVERRDNCDEVVMGAGTEVDEVHVFLLDGGGITLVGDSTGLQPLHEAGCHDGVVERVCIDEEVAGGGSSGEVGHVDGPQYGECHL